MLSGERSARRSEDALRPRLAGNPWTYLTGALLVVAAGAAWAALLRQPSTMATTPVSPDLGSGAMPGESGALGQAATYLGAWGVMMAAMMLPSATPLILLYGAVRRGMEGRGQRGIPAVLFALTYLVVWVALGVPVYATSRLIDELAATNPAMSGALPYAVGGLLAAAGVYQLTPLKRACLRACQSPLGFLLGRWRDGYLGTLRLALQHSAYCVGCCWALMAVLVAAGAMSLPWVLVIAVLVFAEKVLPGGNWAARIAGAALIGLGVVVVFQPDLAMVIRGQAM